MIENILDANGNIIGTLEVPDGTDPTVVSEMLALYAYVPTAMSSVQIVSNSISQAMQFGQGLIIQFAAQNVLSGITQSGQTIAVATYLQPLGYLLNSGSLYGAITVINSLIADTSTTKTNLAPFVTNNILYNYLNQIQTWLGLPLTINPGT
jgi:hypothetical protein